MKPAVLILEATTPIGRALVEAALSTGRPVIAAAADADGLAQLERDYPRGDLAVVHGHAADEASAAALAGKLHEGPILGGVVVATACEPTRGRVLEGTPAALRETFEREVLPYLAAARALLPQLAGTDRNGTFVVLGGPGAEHPWAGYGSRSVAAAATRMLVRVLHDEARALGVRVQMLAVEKPTATDANREHACAHWPTAIAIAHRALELVDQRPERRAPDAIVRFQVPAPPAAPDRRAIHARKPVVLLRPLLTSDNEKA
jgi:NAD(P)-dependent dehydrogenase (short-subunit alcohol dehydrogenase family)